MLARIRRQLRQQVKRSFSIFRPEEAPASAEPAPPPAIGPRSKTMREVISWEFLKGDGLEIGALHGPLPLPPSARVKYVDRISVEELRTHYPELNHVALVPLDIIDDGEKLTSIPDGSQDFLIANHFIEHTQDPIGTIERFLAVLKPGGKVYLAVPDKRGTFDVRRQLTPLEHLYRDREEGPAWSYVAHYYDWAEGTPRVKRTKEEVEAEAQRLLKMEYSIHFHVWTHTTFWEMLMAIRNRYAMPFDIHTLFYNEPDSESIVVLSKT